MRPPGASGTDPIHPDDGMDGDQVRDTEWR